jgi:hypothetical protein
MTCQITAGVLALAIREVRKIPNDVGAVLNRPRPMHFDPIDSYHHRMSLPQDAPLASALRDHDRGTTLFASHDSDFITATEASIVTMETLIADAVA